MRCLAQARRQTIDVGWGYAVVVLNVRTRSRSGYAKPEVTGVADIGLHVDGINSPAIRLYTSGESIVILDIREPDEWAKGYIEGAVLLSRGRIEGRVEEMVPDKDACIVAH